MEGQTAAVWPRRLSLGMGLQWHFYEHQLLTPLNTVQLPAIHALTLQTTEAAPTGVKHVNFFGRKLMRGKGKWAELENHIFIMTIGKLHSF